MSISPLASVAVKRNSRCDGYSWSGAMNEPLLTPANVCSTWEWQFNGQWRMISDHERRDAPRPPSSGSVAEPENEMTSPTFQLSDAAGESIVATGGVLPALITTESVWDRPLLSVTRRPTVTLPGG